MEPRIGFIGLGIMGKPMARNLLKADYELTLHNRSRASVDELASEGAAVAWSGREVAKRSDVVITMLPDSPDSELVIMGEGGILEGAEAGCTIIDMSSIAPLVSQKIAHAAAEKGIDMLDAPVSGGEPGAIAGTLAIMVGGSQETFDRCLPILNVMGRSVVRVGDVGAGNVVKLANQIMVAANIEAIGEAFSLSQKAGIDPDLVFGAIRAGLAGSNALEAKAPMIMDRNFNPGFRIRLHQKDLQNALLTGKDLGVPLPVTSLVQQMLGALMNRDMAECDHSAIVRHVEDMANVEIKKSDGNK